MIRILTICRWGEEFSHTVHHATKLQPWMESLPGTITQPKMAVTVSISLLKSVLSHNWLSYAAIFKNAFLFIYLEVVSFLDQFCFVHKEKISLTLAFTAMFFSLIQALICLVDKKTGEKSKTRPRFVKQDQVCIARLRTAGTICLETFKDFPQMGRFTLRDEGKTAWSTVPNFCKNTVIWNRRWCVAVRY